MRTAAIVALMLAAAGAFAQPAAPACFAHPSSYATLDVARAGRAYAAALASENSGVVESALAQTAMMTLAAPGSTTRDLRRAVGRVAQSAASRELRYKAYVVGRVMDDPALFAGLENGEYGDPDALFGAASARMAFAAAGR